MTYLISLSSRAGASSLSNELGTVMKEDLPSGTADMVAFCHVAVLRKAQHGPLFSAGSSFAPFLGKMIGQHSDSSQSDDQTRAQSCLRGK